MIVTLCGSARFEKAFKDWNEKLTLAGHVVFSLSVYPSDKGFKDWYTPEQKVVLDEVHKLKISVSHAICVIDVETPGDLPYAGESTLSEIDYAIRRRKTVYYVSRHADELLRSKSAISTGIQGAEFDALEKLADQFCRLNLTAIVDDDYPLVRRDYEIALRKFIAALELNGRLQ